MGVGGPSGSGTEEAGWLAEAHRTSRWRDLGASLLELVAIWKMALGPG